MGKRYSLPGFTCPDIDAAIKSVKDLIDELEDLRASNATLRGIAEEAIEERDEMEQRIGELEDEIAVADEKITQLEQRVMELDSNAIVADTYEN